MGIYVYIPIWIDLKDDDFSKQGSLSSNLHSNMDRFESTRQYLPQQRIFYLHSNMDRFESPKNTVDYEGQIKHLHSNMDRFESRHINSTVVIISYYMDIVNMLCINKFNVILNLFICESMIFTVKIAAVDLRHFSVYRRSTVDFLFR